MSCRVRKFKIPDWPRDRPTVPAARVLRAMIYKYHGAGCCLHIALDDGNMREQDLDYCLREAIVVRHSICEQLARMLMLMSPTQRSKV